MRVAAITGLSTEQVAELTKRVTRHLGTSDLPGPRGQPCTLDLYWSIVQVVHLLRKNPTQEVAAAFPNISQATVSRRWDLLRPVLAVVLNDLGYVGVEGIDLIPLKRHPGQATLDPYDVPFNISLTTIRAAVERAVAHMKTWRMLGEEAGRFRPPLAKFTETLAAITGLLNLRRFFNPTIE